MRFPVTKKMLSGVVPSWLLPAGWQTCSPFYFTLTFLLRNGNPKQIHRRIDLISSDVKLFFPQRKTSGDERDKLLTLGRG